MNMCAPFIKRPVMTTLIMLAMLLFGIVGYQRLPVSDLPNVDFPTIQVYASLPGASPETVASAIATPLERQFSRIAGLDSMTSSSALGGTAITLQFNLGRDIDRAAADVQAALSAASGQLPEEMVSPPSYRKVNPAEAPIFYVALTSSTLPLAEVNKYAETFLAQRISMISGVAQVNVFGSQKYAVRVDVDPDLLASRNVSVDEITGAIAANSTHLPTGVMLGQKQSFLIQSEGQLTDASAYRQLIVAYRNGAPIRLQELANVYDGVENNKVGSWYNNKRAIILAIQRQPSSNTIAVVDEIKKMLPQFMLELPKGVSLHVVYDRSVSIKHSIHDVKLTLILAAFVVLLVIFLFLKNFRMTLIPSAALPLSVVGTFAVMAYLGYSLNNLTLLSLTLIVGFVIDDAIVMLENIVRHWERGLAAFDAALQGAKEVGFTIFSMTLSLAAVFIPILFMGGLIGHLFHEFAVTIVIAILISGVVALTLTPMLCARFLPKNRTSVTLPWLRWADILFQHMQSLYEKSLMLALVHHKKVFMVFLLTFFMAIGLFFVVPKGLLPSEDTGQLFAFTEADPSTSYEVMANTQQKIAEIIEKNDSVAAVVSTVGAGGASGASNAGRLFVRLKPREERAFSADEIIAQLRPSLSLVPGIHVYLQNTPSIRLGGLPSKSPYQLTLQDSNMVELAHWAEVIKTRLASLSSMVDVTSDLQFTGPQVKVHIDRDRAAALGVTIKQVENTLYSAFGAREVGSIYTPIDTYQVVMGVKPEYQKDQTALAKLYLRSVNGNLVPMTAMTTMAQSTGPQTVAHQGQIPSVTISFALRSGVSLGQAVSDIEKMKSELVLPKTLVMNFQGTAQAFQASQEGVAWLLLLAILVVYLVLGILYESFIHPLTILSGLPSAGVGALLALVCFNCDLNLYALIGIIMLIGIVKKNAIMMIDVALREQRDHGREAFDAIYQACLMRFRPIMMTTMAALLGALPIAMAFGSGAETRRPLGIAVVGGLLVSQLLTLYITPVIYLYFEKLSLRFKQINPSTVKQPAYCDQITNN